MAHDRLWVGEEPAVDAPGIPTPLVAERALELRLFDEDDADMERQKNRGGVREQSGRGEPRGPAEQHDDHGDVHRVSGQAIDAGRHQGAWR
jgi:hypothetical protein